FNRTDFVTEPGEFSLRGGILDVFSFSNEHPYRIEFFGDEIESIRTFDVESQLSLKQVKKISIVPYMDRAQSQSVRQGFLEYISPDTVVFIKNRTLLQDQIATLFAKAQENFSQIKEGIRQLEPETLFCTDKDI